MMKTPHYPAYFLSLVFLLFLCSRLQAQQSDIYKGTYRTPQGDTHTGQLYIGNIKDNVLKYKAKNEDDWKL